MFRACAVLLAFLMACGWLVAQQIDCPTRCKDLFCWRFIKKNGTEIYYTYFDVNDGSQNKMCHNPTITHVNMGKVAQCSVAYDEENLPFVMEIWQATGTPLCEIPKNNRFGEPKDSCTAGNTPFGKLNWARCTAAK